MKTFYIGLCLVLLIVFILGCIPKEIGEEKKGAEGLSIEGDIKGLEDIEEEIGTGGLDDLEEDLDLEGL